MIPRSRAALTLVAVLALLAPGRLAATPADDEPAAVSEVRIHGNQRIESAVIRSAVRTLAGEPLDRARLRDDVKSVWNLKYFQDVEVQVDASPEGPVVTFVVAEKPLVRKIEITGASEIEDEDLRKEVEVKPYNMLDRQAMRRSEKKLQSKYADKGFYLAEINARTAPASGPNEVDVVFDVNEHAKVEVRRISFQGNQALSDDELRAVMGTREQSLLSFLTSEGTYKEETFQRDLLVLQSLYYSKGYINVRIGRPAVTMTPDRRAILVNIPVEEGEPYDYGEIGVGGDLLGDRDKVQPLVTLKKGARFSSQDLQKVMLAVQDHFRDLGYAYAQVSPRTAVDPQARTVDIDFVVTPGAKVTVERIEVIGNTKTRDKVIRRELRVSEGDYYSGTAVRTSKGRVTALGFFESVDITSRQGSAADTMILEVAVKERATGTFQVGLGFSNSEGLLLNGNINQNNLFGWGTSGAFMVQWSKLRRIFDLSYSDPYFLDTKWTAAFDIFNTLQIYGLLFDRTATGGTITGGYELFEDFRMFVTYTLQKVGVEPGSASSVVLANRFRGGLTSSVKTSFNYDRRDNRLFPTAGYLLSASAEFAQPFFFSQNVFQRYIGIARYYRPLPWGAGVQDEPDGGIYRLASRQPGAPERAVLRGRHQLAARLRLPHRGAAGARWQPPRPAAEPRHRGRQQGAAEQLGARIPAAGRGRTARGRVLRRRQRLGREPELARHGRRRAVRTPHVRGRRGALVHAAGTAALRVGLRAHAPARRSRFALRVHDREFLLGRLCPGPLVSRRPFLRKTNADSPSGWPPRHTTGSGIAGAPGGRGRGRPWPATASCPQAAEMSRPRFFLTMATMRHASRISRKRATRSGSGSA